MKKTECIMGMDVTLNIVNNKQVDSIIFEKVFEYLRNVDEKFSTYKESSEISKINRGEIRLENISEDMKQVFDMSEKTKKDTNNFFNIKREGGYIDPSGLVKGLAIHNAAKMVKDGGYDDFILDIGSDIQVFGKNKDNLPWSIGIKNPFLPETEIIKVVHLSNNEGIATSAKYAKGEHIYNPNDYKDKLDDIVSVTIIAKNIYEADRFATAIFAMGKDGVYFLEENKDLAGYIIDKSGVATMSSNFSKFINKNI